MVAASELVDDVTDEGADNGHRIGDTPARAGRVDDEGTLGGSRGHADEASRQGARPQRPLPQAFEPEPARRVDYELSPRQFNDVDPITSGIRVRRSTRRRGNARH